MKAEEPNRATKIFILKIAVTVVNEWNEYMQKTQHTQQTATRTAQNQYIKTT